MNTDSKHEVKSNCIISLNKNYTVTSVNFYHFKVNPLHKTYTLFIKRNFSIYSLHNYRRNILNVICLMELVIVYDFNVLFFRWMASRFVHRPTYVFRSGVLSFQVFLLHVAEKQYIK